LDPARSGHSFLVGILIDERGNVPCRRQGHLKGGLGLHQSNACFDFPITLPQLVGEIPDAPSSQSHAGRISWSGSNVGGVPIARWSPSHRRRAAAVRASRSPARIPSYGEFVDHPRNAVTLAQLVDHLRAQEFIQYDEFATSESAPVHNPQTAFFAGRRRNSGGGRSNRRGGRNGRGRGNGRGRNGGAPRCQICRLTGHSVVSCYKRYDDRPAAHANMAFSSDSSGHTTADAWYPDTGASAHATPDAQMMDHSEPYSENDVLKIGNGTGLGVSSVGRTVIRSDSHNFHMSNILHVPKLAIPLLSVYRFTNENNVFFEFHKNLFFVKDCTTRAILLRGSTIGGLYKLILPRGHNAFLSARASSVVWH